MADQSLEASYPEIFQEFRTWRMLHWISHLAVFGVGTICIAFGHFAVWPDAIFIMGSFVFVAITYAKLRWLRCPRCHKDFFFLLHFYPIFLREGCYFCGLAIYRDDATT
jgi:hypothetical protein